LPIEIENFVQSNEGFKKKEEIKHYMLLDKQNATSVLLHLTIIYSTMTGNLITSAPLPELAYQHGNPES